MTSQARPFTKDDTDLSCPITVKDLNSELFPPLLDGDPTTVEILSKNFAMSLKQLVWLHRGQGNVFYTSFGPIRDGAILDVPHHELKFIDKISWFENGELSSVSGYNYNSTLQSAGGVYQIGFKYLSNDKWQILGVSVPVPPLFITVSVHAIVKCDVMKLH